VEAVVSEDDKVFIGAPQDAFRTALVGARVLGAHRLGKHLWLTLSTKPCVAFHLGMTGSWSVRNRGVTKYKAFAVDAVNWPPRFAKLVLTLDNGEALAFTDPRRFARVRLADDPAVVAPISELRGDPLLAPLGCAKFLAILSKRSAAVKALLLDQSVCAGVGNWVADEALYAARVHPETPCNALGEAAGTALYEAVASICRTAVACDADSSRFPSDWLFHVRWGKKAGSIGGHALQFVTVGGRTSAFVPFLQKKVGGAIVAAVDGAGDEAVEEAVPTKKAAKKRPAAAAAAVPTAKKAVAAAAVSSRAVRASTRLMKALL
jgi:formamidopyrimidine-DNA glycosylase